MNDHKGTWPSPDIVYTDMYVYRNYSDPAWSHQPDRPITWFTTTQRPTYHDSYMPVTTTTTIPSSSTLADIDQCDLSNQMPYPDVTQLPWVVTFLTVVYLIIMVLSICGNALVILTVWRNSHMHTVTNYYIVNLAVSDLLVSVLVMPLKLLEYISPCAWNVFGNPVLCPILYYILPIFVFASVLTLVAISLERYYAIVHPLSAMKFNSKSRTRRILAATWVIPVVLASPYTFSKSYAFVISSEMGSISRQICTDRFDEIDTLMYGSGVSGRFRSGFFIFLFLVIYLLPMLVILATCVRIAICLLQPISVRRWPPATRKDTGRRHEENKRKVARMVIVVAVAFIVSWSPFYLSTLVSQIQIMKQEDSFLRERNFLFTMLMIHLCGFLNSCINPLIYTGMSKKFRRSFKKILGGCICCRLGHRFLRYRDSLNRGMSAAFTSSYRQSMTEVRDANDLGLSEAGSSSADSTTRYSTRSNPTANNGSQRGNHGNLLQRNIYHQRRHNNNQHLHHHHHHLHNVDQEQLQTSPDLKKKGGFRLLKSRDQGDVLIQLKPMKKKGNAETDEQHEASLLTKPRAGSAEDLAKEEDTTPIVINRREPGSDDEDDVEQGTQLLLKKDNSAGALFKEDDLAPKANGSARTVANGGSHQILRDRSGEWKPRTDKRQGEGVMMSDVVRGTQVTRHVPNQYEEVVHAGFLQDGQCVQL